MKKSGDQNKAIGFLRVSTDEQNNGPEAQRVELERWCKVHGVELLAVYEEHGVSGAAPLDKRLVLMEAVDAVKAQGAGILLVAKRDRLARDVIAAAMIERLVERNGAHVLSANEVGNGEGPEDILMRRILDAFGEYERALIRARTRAALAVKRGRGEKTGGREAPYGFRPSEDGRRLEAHQGEQEIIRTARELAGQGLSLRQIGQALESRGLLPRRGAKWNPKTVRALLTSREPERVAA